MLNPLIPRYLRTHDDFHRRHVHPKFDSIASPHVSHDKLTLVCVEFHEVKMLICLGNNLIGRSIDEPLLTPQSPEQIERADAFLHTIFFPQLWLNHFSKLSD